jgi:hypothetical protein
VYIGCFDWFVLQKHAFITEENPLQNNYANVNAGAGFKSLAFTYSIMLPTRDPGS